MNKEKVQRILDVFDQMYPDAKCELVHQNELELLIAVMLSAQTTDASVNKLTAHLFQKYRCVEDYANAPLSQLEEDLRTIGLYRNKAKNVKAMAQKLMSDFNGQVPCNHEALQTLPGVGRKTENVVVSNAFGQDAIAVDTHVFRVANRLGLVHAKDAKKTEEQLMEHIPQEQWSIAHHWLIWHGRRVCSARNPKCQGCPCEIFCEFAHKQIKKADTKQK